MTTLNHTEARTIAESLWGRGGTNSYKTNRKGVFYFSCSGHGGYVLSWNALTDAEKAAIESHVSVDMATRAKAPRNRNILMHPYMGRSKRYYGGTEENIPFVLLEEDCDWSIAHVLTDVRRIGRDTENDMAYARDTLARWIEPRAAKSAA